MGEKIPGRDILYPVQLFLKGGRTAFGWVDRLSSKG
jgi:hypothetical protein